ncbi:MAG: hypothetical protein HY822_19385 [Acidobacteria bacterium]|nr:hypothetical protein [Acidobacteriota bacterium]
MAQNSWQGMLEALVGGRGGSSAETFASLDGQMQSLGEKLSEVVRASAAQTRTVEENTSALAKNTPAGVAGTVKSVVSSVAGSTALSGAGMLTPLLSGITKLLGGSRDEPAAPVPYAWPEPLRIEAAIGSDGRAGGVSYDAGGLPRMATVRAAEVRPQINIQVQAMDSRSFLDHSEEIARAVRQAMLESHVLSDVASEF